jgi:hypothetical protein
MGNASGRCSHTPAHTFPVASRLRGAPALAAAQTAPAAVRGRRLGVRQPAAGAALVVARFAAALPVALEAAAGVAAAAEAV